MSAVRRTGSLGAPSAQPVQGRPWCSCTQPGAAIHSLWPELTVRSGNSTVLPTAGGTHPFWSVAEHATGLRFDRLVGWRVPWIGPVTPVQLDCGLIQPGPVLK